MAKIEEQGRRETAKGPEQAGSGSQELREQFNENEKFEREAASEYKKIKNLTGKELEEIRKGRRDYNPFDENRFNRNIRHAEVVSLSSVPEYLKDIKKQELSVAVGSPEEIQKTKERADREYLHKSIGFARAAFEGGDKQVAANILSKTDALKDPKISEWFMGEMVRLTTSENPKEFEEAKQLRSGMNNEFVGKVRERARVEMDRLRKMADQKYDIEVPSSKLAIEQLENQQYKNEDMRRTEQANVQRLEGELESNQDGAITSIFKRISGGRTRSDIEKQFSESKSRVEQLQLGLKKIEDQIKKLKDRIQELQDKRNALYQRAV